MSLPAPPLSAVADLCARSRAAPVPEAAVALREAERGLLALTALIRDAKGDLVSRARAAGLRALAVSGGRYVVVEPQERQGLRQRDDGTPRASSIPLQLSHVPATLRFVRHGYGAEVAGEVSGAPCAQCGSGVPVGAGLNDPVIVGAVVHVECIGAAVERGRAARGL